MSDPKPPRFARASVSVRTPSWLPPKDRPARVPELLRPPRVQVEGIDGGAEGDAQPMNEGPEPVAWTAPVSSQGTQISLRPEQAEAHVEQVAELQAQLAKAKAEAESLQASLQEVTGDAQEAQQRYANAVLDLASARSEVLAGIERQLLELAVLVAEQIIEDEVAGRPELHRVLVETALEHMAGDRKLTLRASPDGYDAIVEGLGGTEVELSGAQLTIKVDRELGGLGCVLESDNRRVDGRLSERLSAIRRSFLAESQRRDQEEAS
ncbi:MAG: FliH/SctL family protein [Myxococcales bacterium]|nr:FliH/SctL family protein [Myxococcales bacterium]